MRIKVWAMTDRVGSKMTIEMDIDDESLEGLDEDARNRLIDDEAWAAISQHINFGWEPA